MNIRAAQMRRFNKNMNNRLVEQSAQDVHAHFPEIASQYTDEALKEAIRAAMDRAYGYQLVRDRQVRSFVLLTFSVSSRFDFYPPFLGILSSPYIHNSVKLDVLFRSATPAEWQAAALLDEDVAQPEPVEQKEAAWK